MAKQIELTNKREKWVGNRDVVLKGEPLPANIAVEQAYKRKLDRLVDAMAKETEREVKKLLASDTAKEGYAMDESLISQARILMNKLARKYDRVFSEHARGYAKYLARQVDGLSKRNTGASLKKLSGGLTIKTDFSNKQIDQTIKGTIYENVDLIKSIQSEYFDKIKGDIYRSITGTEIGGLKGLTERINKALTSRYKQHRNKAKNIALNETRKLYNQLNAQRMEAVGIKKFQWNHSGGSQEPRKSHQEMDGKIYSYDDLPVIDERTGQRGLPGEAINCRCFATPVIEFEDGEEVG